MSVEQLSLLQPTSGATFSECRRYRYRLWREVNSQARGTVAFIGLNPSTADEMRDDPTIRRCIGFARDWGFRHLEMLNIFAFRSTDPAGLKTVDDPVGVANDTFLERAAETDLVIAAWGVHGVFRDRGQAVRRLLVLHHLGLTKDGHPRHPLYLPKTVKPQRWHEADHA